MKEDPWFTDRLAADLTLVKAERRIERALLAAMGHWLDTVKALMLGRTPPDLDAMTAALEFTVDVDAAQASFGAWVSALEQTVEPAIADAFGAGFAGNMRVADVSPLPFQERHMQDVFDRLKIWPEGAFEDLRPELLQAVTNADTIDDVTDRIGTLLDINAPTRRLRQQITAVDGRIAEALANGETTGVLRGLRAQRRGLWEEHDRSLGEWQYLARRIARTEVQGAVEGGALASAQATEQATGEKMFKRWLATHDARCRRSHLVADGQIVRLTDKFRVGTSELDHPADPRGKDSETINCRCTIVVMSQAEVDDALRGKWGRRGVAPMSQRLGPDLPEDVDASMDLLKREQAGEDVSWPDKEPDPEPVAVPDVVAEPVVPAETVAGQSVSSGRYREQLRKEFKGVPTDDFGDLAERAILNDDFELLQRVADEEARRASERLRDAARREKVKAQREAAQSAKYDELIEAGVDEESAISEAFGLSIEQVRRTNAIAWLRGGNFQGRTLDELVKDWHRQVVREEVDAATNSVEVGTHTLKPQYRGDTKFKYSTADLWTLPYEQARRYASDELLKWWDNNGRTTWQDLKAQVMDPSGRELAERQAATQDYLR